MEAFFIGSVVGLSVLGLTIFGLNIIKFIQKYIYYFLSFAASFAFAQAFFIQLPKSSLVLGLDLFTVLAISILLFVYFLHFLLDPDLIERKKEFNIVEKRKYEFIFIAFIIVHTVAEGLAIGLKTAFLEGIIISDLIIEIIHEVPEIALIMLLYYTIFNNKNTLYYLLISVSILYPITALITDLSITYNQLAFASFIKVFLLGWYTTFGILTLNLLLKKNIDGALYLFGGTIIFMLGFTKIVGI